MSTTALIVLAIFFIFGIIGFIRGFFKKIFTIVTLIACIFIAGALTIPISNIAMQNTQMDKFTVKIIVYLSICLAVYVAMRIIFAVLRLAKRFKAVSVANHVGGLFVGLGEGFIVVWIFMMFVTMLSFLPIGQGALAQINDNRLLKAIYDGNLLWNFVHV